MAEILTSDNVLALMEKQLQNAPVSGKTMLMLAFYMDFAISTESLLLVQLVQDRITKYYLENFS